MLVFTERDDVASRRRDPSYQVRVPGIVRCDKLFPTLIAI